MRTTGAHGGITDRQLDAKLAQRGLPTGYAQRYRGLVCDKARINSAASAAQTKAMSPAWYIAPSPITRPTSVHTNWHVAATWIETAANAPCAVTCWIEYPIGATLSAPVSAVIPAGGTIELDHGPIAIPAGEAYVVWTLRDGPLMPYCGRGDVACGDAIAFGANAPAAPILGGRLTAGFSAGNGYYPLVVDWTDRRTVASIGDSNEFGFGDTADGGGYLGIAERFYRAQLAHLNVSIAGDSLASFLAAGNAVRRLALLQYVSDVQIGLAGNDISNARTAAAIIADIKRLAALVPAGKRRCTFTEFPKTTSSNAFASVAGQTVTAEEPIRLTVNAFKRSSGGVFDYIVEMERPVAAANGAAIVWDVDPGGIALTDDGRHHNRTGYRRIGGITGKRVA